MSGIIRRDATIDDAAALAKFFSDQYTATFGHLYDPADLAAFLENQTRESWAKELPDPDFAVRLAEQDGAIVGYAKFGPPHLPFTPSAGAAELRQLYIIPLHHGNGIANELIEWVCATARSRRASDLYLSVYVDNHRAHRFYAKLGFEEGRYAFMVGNQADEDIVMRLTL
ncbi:MAG TPA: GNAT family N-acetyltransferase [Sphingomonas sp.]|nr:GNAT family N-acetyltransferase [Sphingomonas sp.]